MLTLVAKSQRGSGKTFLIAVITFIIGNWSVQPHEAGSYGASGVTSHPHPVCFPVFSPADCSFFQCSSKSQTTHVHCIQLLILYYILKALEETSEPQAAE